jgi:lauroyl/myristoyl acyltransferase
VVVFAVDEEVADAGSVVLVVALAFGAAVVVPTLISMLLVVTAIPVVLVTPVIKQLQANFTLALFLEQPDSHVGTAAAEVVVTV